MLHRIRRTWTLNSVLVCPHLMALVFHTSFCPVSRVPGKIPSQHVIVLKDSSSMLRCSYSLQTSEAIKHSEQTWGFHALRINEWLPQHLAVYCLLLKKITFPYCPTSFFTVGKGAESFVQPNKNYSWLFTIERLQKTWWAHVCREKNRWLISFLSVTQGLESWWNNHITIDDACRNQLDGHLSKPMSST